MRRALVTLVALAACGNWDSPRAALVTAVLGTRLVVHVTDGSDGPPLGARVLLFTGSGAPLAIGAVDLFGQRQGEAACALAPGAIGTIAGIIVAPSGADIRVGDDHCTPSPAISYGQYTVWVWHGIDHERWEGKVDLGEDRGRVDLTVPLERAWTASDALQSDLHVHAAASDDSAMPNTQRVLAQVAAGIQVTALSNHNVPDSAATAISELGLGSAIAAIPSIELTTVRAHVGIYPAPLDRSVGSDEIADLEPDALLALAHTFPGDPIIQLNHPRFRATAMYDYESWDGKSWPPPFPLTFNAVEVINGFTAFNDAAGSDRRLDDSVRDLYTLVDHGHPIAALGNSDSHDYNWVADGAARSFVFAPQPFAQASFIEAIRQRHTEATTGPYLQVTASRSKGEPGVGPGGQVTARDGYVWLDVTVSAARFVVLDRLRVTVGTPLGATLTEQIPLVHGERVRHWAGKVYVNTVDTWIGVTADGDTPLPLEQTGTYQRDKWGRAGDTPFAVISPILVDADGDGRWRRGDAK
jgi:hypothetical protein